MASSKSTGIGSLDRGSKDNSASSDVWSSAISVSTVWRLTTATRSLCLNISIFHSWIAWTKLKTTPSNPSFLRNLEMRQDLIFSVMLMSSCYWTFQFVSRAFPIVKHRRWRSEIHIPVQPSSSRQVHHLKVKWYRKGAEDCEASYQSTLAWIWGRWGRSWTWSCPDLGTNERTSEGGQAHTT